jgi:hypothetical protein
MEPAGERMERESRCGVFAARKRAVVVLMACPCWPRDAMIHPSLVGTVARDLLIILLAVGAEVPPICWRRCLCTACVLPTKCREDARSERAKSALSFDSEQLANSKERGSSVAVCRGKHRDAGGKVHTCSYEWGSSAKLMIRE